MNMIAPPGPGGVPGGASWLTKFSSRTASTADSSLAGKTSSRKRTAPALFCSSVGLLVGRVGRSSSVIFMPVSFSPMSENATPRRQYDSTKRREQAAATRRRIIDTAARVFIERGYAGATIPVIAAEAGVAVETVYRSAVGKAGLLREA